MFYNLDCRKSICGMDVYFRTLFFDRCSLNRFLFMHSILRVTQFHHWRWIYLGSDYPMSCLSVLNIYTGSFEHSDIQAAYKPALSPRHDDFNPLIVGSMANKNIM